MKRATLLLLAPLFYLAACGDAPLPSATAALDLADAGAPVQVPFTAHADFAADLEGPTVLCTPLQYGIHPPANYYGAGVTTHLGLTSVALTFDACSIGPGARFNASGHVVQTAASGDQLRSSFAMTQYENGDFTVTEMSITGGSGRFAEAIGTATGSGWISRGAGGTYQGQYDLNGTMSPPRH